jgi:hypothetical protein
VLTEVQAVQLADNDYRVHDLAALADALHRADANGDSSVVRQRLAVCLALRTLELAEDHGFLLWDAKKPSATTAECAMRDLWGLSRALIVADATRYSELLPALAALIDIYCAAVSCPAWNTGRTPPARATRVIPWRECSGHHAMVNPA